MCTKLTALLAERGGCTTGLKAVVEIEFACLWGIIFPSKRRKVIPLNYRGVYGRGLVFTCYSLLRSFMHLCVANWVNNLNTMNSFSVSDQPVNSLRNHSSCLHVEGQHYMLLKSNLSHTLEHLGAARVARAVLIWDILGVNHGIWVTFNFY